MKSITVIKKDGTKKEFHHQGRVGGSYTISIRYEDNFAIVSDEWENETIFPSDSIDEIKTEQFRRM